MQHRRQCIDAACVPHDGLNLLTCLAQLAAMTVEMLHLLFLLQRHGKMREADAAILVGDVLHVLSECNKQRICYADIKPANILLKSQYPELRLGRLDCQVDSTPGPASLLRRNTF